MNDLTTKNPWHHCVWHGVTFAPNCLYNRMNWIEWFKLGVGRCGINTAWNIEFIVFLTQKKTTFNLRNQNSAPYYFSFRIFICLELLKIGNRSLFPIKIQMIIILKILLTLLKIFSNYCIKGMLDLLVDCKCADAHNCSETVLPCSATV